MAVRVTTMCVQMKMMRAQQADRQRARTDSPFRELQYDIPEAPDDDFVVSTTPMAGGPVAY